MVEGRKKGVRGSEALGVMVHGARGWPVRFMRLLTVAGSIRPCFLAFVPLRKLVLLGLSLVPLCSVLNLPQLLMSPSLITHSMTPTHPLEFVQVCHRLLDCLTHIVAIQEQRTLGILNLRGTWYVVAAAAERRWCDAAG